MKSKVFCKIINKKIIILSLSVFLFSPFSFAQVKLGLKFNPLVGYIRPDTKNMKSDGLIPGFSYGLILENKFSDHYYFYTEFSITHKGGYVERNDSLSTVRNSYYLRYLEIPLALKLRTNPVGNRVYYGQFGIVPSILVRAKTDEDNINKSNKKLTTESNIDVPNMEPLALAMLIGAGVNFEFKGNTMLNLGLLYNNGFTNIMQSNSKDIRLTTSYFAINVGLLF